MNKHEKKKRGTAMSTFYQEVLRKPEKTNDGKKHSTPKRGVKHYAYPSSFLRNFSGFLVNDEHNASKSICSDRPKSPSESNHQCIICADSSNSWQK